MSGIPNQVYNPPVNYLNDQSTNAGYPPPHLSQPGSYESFGDAHPLSGGLTNYPSPFDQYSDPYSTPNSQEYHPGYAPMDISQTLTVHPHETNPFLDPYFPQPSHASTPPTPNAFGHNGPTWTGSADLIDAHDNVRNCEEYRTNQAIPRPMLTPFLQRNRLPASPTGRGSRQGAKSYICLWPQCGKELARRDHGVTHVAGHFGSKPFVCGKCKRGFLRIADKKRHIKMSCDKREMSIGSGHSSGSSTSGTSGSDSGAEPAQPSRYTSQIEVWRSIMGSWRLSLRWIAREAG